MGYVEVTKRKGRILETDLRYSASLQGYRITVSIEKMIAEVGESRMEGN